MKSGCPVLQIRFVANRYARLPTKETNRSGYRATKAGNFGSSLKHRQILAKRMQGTAHIHDLCRPTGGAEVRKRANLHEFSRVFADYFDVLPTVFTGIKD
jgi:hypothetical protein